MDARLLDAPGRAQPEAQPRLSDRRRCELALVPSLFWRLTWQITTDEVGNVYPEVDPAWRRRMLDAFMGEVATAIGGSEKLMRRVVRTRSSLLSSFTGTEITDVLIGVIHLTQVLLLLDRLELKEGSPFDMAYQELIGVVRNRPENAQRVEERDTQGRVIGLQLVERLNDHGMFTDLPMPGSA